VSAAAVPPEARAPVPPPMDEAVRRAELASLKRVASGFLVVALVVFIVARFLEPTYPWLGFVRATAEASLVGGLADWFAVTALFRRPLGLPIPHTAIIQNQKDRIGQVLANFIQRHFLSRDVLSAKLHSMRLAERIARWISTPENGARLARDLAVGVAQAVQTLPEEDARELIRSSALARLQKVKLAPVLSKLLSAVTTDDRHQALFDEALRMASDAIHANRDQIRWKIREESPWWVPGLVDDVLYQKLLAGAQSLLTDVASHPYHPLRRRFDTAFREFVDRLEHSPHVQARTEEIKEDLLGHPMVEELASTLWDRARQAAERFSDRTDEGPGVQALARGINALGESLLASPERLVELDDFMTDFVASLLEQHRHEVSDLITVTVSRWDPEAAAQRIELAVGRDLQFIRLNGTLVGGLAGLIIYTVSLLFR
jgi:uncharacterized membrane-anchored protein YjiN (DUF445 family)